MKKSVKPIMFYIAFVSSLGGLLFGFDTAVISGAEKAIKQVYQLSEAQLGFTVAIALIGTIIGALVCAKPTEKYGRLRVLLVIAVGYLISAIGCAAFLNWYSLLFFRFLGGLAVGASSVIGPMYNAEVAPSRWRGRFVAFFQFNIVLGIVLAYFSNYFINGIGDNDWRWMLGAMAIPAALFTVLLFTIPESPRWLVKVGREDDARKVLDMIGEEDTEVELGEIKESFVSMSMSERLFQRKYLKPILIAFGIATFNQLAGINAVLYYAPRIFEVSGSLRESAMGSSIIIGLTNLTFTMIGMVLIDKLGRKNLLYMGTLLMAAALFAVSYGFYFNKFEGYYMLICLMAFIAMFAISLGAVIWVLIAEVFPTSVRAKGQVLGSMTHWVWCAILTWTFPLFINSESVGTGQGNISGAIIFAFFGVMVALAFVFALKLPDTQNKTLEEIQKELTTRG